MVVTCPVAGSDQLIACCYQLIARQLSKQKGRAFARPFPLPLVLRLVPSKPRPREFLPESRGGSRRQNADSEVQQSADNNYLDRKGNQEESQANQPAE